MTKECFIRQFYANDLCRHCTREDYASCPDYVPLNDTEQPPNKLFPPHEPILPRNYTLKLKGGNNGRRI